MLGLEIKTEKREFHKTQIEQFELRLRVNQLPVFMHVAPVKAKCDRRTTDKIPTCMWPFALLVPQKYASMSVFMSRQNI